MQKYKVLIDTDIGDDIDDAFALALAMRDERVELVGITTCFKNTALRARIAKKLLSAAGCNAPVYAGVPTSDAVPCQYDADGFEAEGKTGTAAQFIVDCVQKYGDELTVLAIGPLNNLAAAVELNPAVMKNARVYLMGGNYFGGKFEWNIRCAPLAAATVFGGCNVWAAGSDVTAAVRLSDEEREKIVADKRTPLNAELGALTDLWYQKEHRAILLHDPATLLMLTDPELFTMVEQNIYVVTDGVLKGLTVNFSLSKHFVQQAGSPVVCAQTVDARQAAKKILDTIYGKGA